MHVAFRWGSSQPSLVSSQFLFQTESETTEESSKFTLLGLWSACKEVMVVTTFGLR